MSSLFEKIGGKEAVNAAVDVFYKKVLADNRPRQVYWTFPLNILFLGF